MKKVAMIPVLLGSTRIPDKNLLLVDGYPLLWRVAQACKKAGVFDEVVVNSEHEKFEELAKMLGVNFYKRDPRRGGSACAMKNKSRSCAGERCQTHDHFLADFMESRQDCLLALVHTTSPLLKPETIKEFMGKLENEGYDSLFTVEQRYTETFYDGKPVNFSMSRKIPTQTLPPLQLITWALSGWRTQSFLDSYRRDDGEETGPTFCGKTGVFPLDKVSALDGDTWEDLFMIEACLRHRRQQEKPGEYKWTEDMIGIEHELCDLISDDGVSKYVDTGANARLTGLEEIKKKMGPAPWLYLLVYSNSDQTALICQRPGEGARKHCHVTHREWWVVLEGEFEWQFGDGKNVKAKAGSVVICPPGLPHRIVCISKAPGIRLANGARDFEHIYFR